MRAWVELDTKAAHVPSGLDGFCGGTLSRNRMSVYFQDHSIEAGHGRRSLRAGAMIFRAGAGRMNPVSQALRTRLRRRVREFLEYHVIFVCP
jgi:hypothetical protein